MHALAQLGLDRAELGAHRLLARDPLQLEPSAPVLRADVREAEEVERFGLAKTLCFTILGGEPSELDQPSLVLVQHQIELRKPLAQLSPEPFGVVAMLEAQHQII